MASSRATRTSPVRRPGSRPRGGMTAGTITFVCGPETMLAQSTFGDCPAAGCRRAYVKVHVKRDGTVGDICEWPEGKEANGCQ